MYFKDDIFIFVLTNFYVLGVSFFIVYALITLLLKKQSNLLLYGRLHIKSQKYKRYNLLGGVVVWCACVVAMSVFSILNVLDVLLYVKLSVFSALFVGLGCYAYKFRFSMVFLIQVALAVLVVWSLQLPILNFKGFLGVYFMSPFWSFAVSVMVIIGCVNLFHFINKLEGLGLAFALLVAIIYCNLSLRNSNTLMFYLNVSVFGSLLSLWALQMFKENKVYLSKGGAFFIGFYVALQLIWGVTQVHQYEMQNSIAFYSAVFSYPLIVALQIVFTAILNYFKVSKNNAVHLHEYLVTSGLTKFQYILSVLGFTTLMVILSLKITGFNTVVTSGLLLVIAVLLWGIFLYLIRVTFSNYETNNN